MILGLKRHRRPSLSNLAVDFYTFPVFISLVIRDLPVPARPWYFTHQLTLIHRTYCAIDGDSEKVMIEINVGWLRSALCRYSSRFDRHK